MNDVNAFTTNITISKYPNSEIPVFPKCKFPHISLDRLNVLRMGEKTYCMANFSRKLHEDEKKFGLGWRRGRPLLPPLRKIRQCAHTYNFHWHEMTSVLQITKIIITNFLGISNEKGHFGYQSLSQDFEWKPQLKIQSIKYLLHNSSKKSISHI